MPALPTILALSLAALSASAAPPAPATDDASLTEAKERFAAGKAAFEAGDYDKAIAHFEAARAVRPSPILDYNVALAWEKLGRLDLAVTGFEAYLRQDPDAANRATVEQRVADLRARMARDGAYAQPPSAPAGAPGTVPPVPPVAATAPAAGTPSPPIPARRYAVSLRGGVATAGGLGRHALGDTANVEATGSLIAPAVRLAFPNNRFELEVGLEAASFRGAGQLGRTSLRSKFGWVLHASTRPLDVVFAAGIDINVVSYTYRDRADVSQKVTFSPAFGVFLELATLRYALSDRWEIMVAPVGLHLLPALGSNQKQVLDATGTMVAAAKALDVNQASRSYSFTIGAGYRF